jgi:hypothetical protein
MHSSPAVTSEVVALKAVHGALKPSGTLIGNPEYPLCAATKRTEVRSIAAQIGGSGASVFKPDSHDA